MLYVYQYFFTLKVLPLPTKNTDRRFRHAAARPCKRRAGIAWVKLSDFGRGGYRCWSDKPTWRSELWCCYIGGYGFPAGLKSTEVWVWVQ